MVYETKYIKLDRQDAICFCVYPRKPFAIYLCCVDEDFFVKKPCSVGTMMIRLPLVKCISLLFMTQPALSANKSNVLEIPPISLPASELWYVALTAGNCF